ncbi:hypothetical protein [Streptomyces sp. NPDC048248]
MGDSGRGANNANVTDLASTAGKDELTDQANHFIEMGKAHDRMKNA